MIDKNSQIFTDFTKYLWELVSHNITPLLVVWWWYQISKNRESIHPWVPRTKWEDGWNFTSEELLKLCVIPASNEIIDTLSPFLKATKVSWEHIFCEKVLWLWYVWIPKYIEHSFKKGEAHIIPFVWKDENKTDNYLNINADDIALYLWKTLWKEVSKIFFLTGSGWILDKNGKNISFLTKSAIESILRREHKKVNIYGWMYKKLQIIQGLIINGSSSLVVTHLKDFKNEIERVIWCGTYVINEKDIETLNTVEYDFFIELYEIQKTKWHWKERSKDEIYEAWSHHKILSINGIPLWGVSIKEYFMNQTKWFLIECLWVAEEWNGIWRILFEKILTWYRPLFSYSQQEIFFEKMWFIKNPSITSETGKPLFVLK